MKHFGWFFPPRGVGPEAKIELLVIEQERAIAERQEEIRAVITDPKNSPQFKHIPTGLEEK